MQTNFYTLPEISFVGGETQTFSLSMKRQNEKTGKLESFDLTDAEVFFSVADYSDKTGKPLLSYGSQMIKIENDANNIPSVATLTIPKEDTALLSGKFEYQVTVIDLLGQSCIPNKGIMYIAKNINQELVQSK